MNKKITTLIWLAAICLVMVAAYTFYSKNKTQIIQPPVDSQETTQATNSGAPKAPDFSLKDMDGNTVKLSDYKGKVVILNFWAVWCKYCLEEMPDLNELNKELEKDGRAVLLAVDAQESIDVVDEYLTENKIDLKVLLDQDGAVTQAYGISGFPTTFIIDKDGSLFTYVSGKTDKETLKNKLKSLDIDLDK